jgi:hypothetical protein
MCRVKLLKQKDKNASPEWLTKLPQMVKQLEVSLYRSAPSFEAYSDTSTLKSRLQQLAMEIAKKTQQTKDGSGGVGHDGDGGGQSLSRGQSSHRSLSGASAGQQQRMGDNDDVMDFNNMQSAPSGAGRGDNYASVGDEAMSNQHGNPNDPDWKVRIRHKQQRLLLLHHSSKCPYEDGKCKTTPYCGEMKTLWKHMARCTDNECRVPHCFSSRSILSHYRKCKDPQCPACGPVRDTVRKTQENQRRRSQQQGGGSHVPSDSMGGIGGGNNSYGMPQDVMGGMQRPNNNNMGMFQQISSNNAPLVNPIGSDMMVPSRMGNMSNVMQGINNMSHQNNSGPMTNGSTHDNGGSMQPTTMNSMFLPGQQNHNSSMAHPQQLGVGSQMMINGSANNSSSIKQMMPPPPNGSSCDPNVNDANDSLKTEPDAKARHKRQRLLLLRHASKCTAENGTCETTPHCADMKVLWKHIANCKDSYCKVRHCMSSRYVLSHYRRCKPPCNICDPVREIIKNGFNNIIEVDPAIMEGSGVCTSASPPLDNSSMQQPPTKRPKLEHSSGEMLPPLPSDNFNNGKDKENPLGNSDMRQQVERQQSPKPNASNPTEDHSLLECFTTEQVKTHIQSLKTFAKLAPPELKIKCLEILKGLQTHEHGWVFAAPVNPDELGLVDYFDIIKKPMDLGTIQKKLDLGSYHSFDDFRSDVRLTFENAMKYNEERTVVHEMAKDLKKKFETDFKKLMKQLEKEHFENSMKVQACGLCACEKLNFEPPVFFCNGVNCPTTRIRRNTHFYISADKQYAWCNQCFGEIKGDTVDCGTSKVKKSELIKRKNDEVHEESWVQCDDCERWIHQICGLYNTRHDKDNKSAYSCPLCLLEKRNTTEDPPNLPEAPSANDIPRTKLSDWLERDVHKRVDVRMKELSQEKAEAEVRLFVL